jgi:hypothetical protein
MAQKTNPKRTQNPPMPGMLTTILSLVTASGGRDAVTSHGWSRSVAPGRAWSRGFKKKKIVYFLCASPDGSIGTSLVLGCCPESFRGWSFRQGGPSARTPTPTYASLFQPMPATPHPLYFSMVAVRKDKFNIIVPEISARSSYVGNV